MLLERYNTDIANLYSELRDAAIVTTIREATGAVEVLNDVKDFESIYQQLIDIINKANKLSAKINYVNNTAECMPGITIQSALTTLKRLRELRKQLASISSSKDSKTRRSDTNGSAYYYIQEVAFDREWLKNEINNIDNHISQLEAAVLKLNSEIEIDI